MKSLFRKNIIGEVRGSLGRFLAIMVIVALGVGFLAGLLTTAPVMRGSIDSYYDESNFHDLSVMSTLGLDEEDLSALSAVEGVEAVMPFYQKDVTVLADNGDVLAVRILSRDFSLQDSKNRSAQDRLTLLKGRFPENKTECVVTQKMLMSAPICIGDTLTVTKENGDVSDALCVTRFTVVGLVSDAAYFSIEHESTTVGSGTLHDIVYTTEDAFTYAVYTNAYAVIKDGDTLDSFSQAYTDLADTVADRIEKTGSQRSTARYNKIVSEARAALGSAQKEYDAQKAAVERQLAEAEKQIEDGQKEYDDGIKKLEAGKTEYENGLAAYKNAEQQLQTTKSETEQQFADAQAQIDRSEQQLLAAKEELDNARSLVELTRSLIDMLEKRDRAALEKLLTQLEQQYPEWEELQEPIREAIRQIEEQNNAEIDALVAALHTKYDDRIREYDAGLAAYNEGILQLEKAKTQLTTGRITWAAEEAKATLKLEQAANELEKSKQELENGEKELTDAKTELESARKQYESGKTTAEQQLADAKAQIRDAEKQLADFSAPTWYVFTRSSNVSYKSFADNADKMEAIARVFPLFFFLVAALVALTTMTRMVEEQRVQIGTFKALGYADGVIMSKYLLYAGSASLIGCVIGLVLGLTTLPTIIWAAYGIMYDFPHLHLQFPVGISLIASGAALVCTLLATFLACRSTLKESPASLMLPKAPKAGKRILLERIRPLWSRLRFSHKITARNLFRYKKRLFMTVFGIAGCTALLVTGFGLRDSIGSICDKQFSKLQSYDLSIYCSEISDELTEHLSESSDVSRFMTAFQQSVNAENAAEESRFGKTMNVYLFVPEDSAALTTFITMRTRTDHREVAFTEDAAVITEKLAETLGLSVGDSVLLLDQDNHRYTVPVGGMIENYVYSYVYVPRALYETTFDEDFRPNSILTAISGADSKETRDRIGADILTFDEVQSVQFSEDISNSFDNIIKSIDSVVYILILSAAALAFVVLYNLTNINITERQRELATLKVLGFYNRETAMYIFREVILLSLLGTAVGLGLGVALHAYIIRTVEVDMVMFSRQITPLSFLLSALLTMLFSLLVNAAMYPKMKRIDMVESLKSVD